MKELRLLFVTPFYKPAHIYGGPTFSIPTLCEALSDLGCQTTVFTTNANGKKKIPVMPGMVQNVDAVDVYYFKRELAGNYFYSPQLREACNRQISKKYYDLVYVASSWGYPFLAACPAAKKARIPYVISPRASYKRNTWRGKFIKKISYHWLFERRWINRSSLLHYTTILEATDSKWLNISTPSVIIPNPVNMKEFDKLPERGLFRNTYHLPEKEKILLFLGRIDPDKGLDIALQAFSRVSGKVSNLTFVIAGPEEDNQIYVLKKLADQLEIANRVLFTGLLDRKKRLEALVDANLFISTSRSENFGMSIVEAMVCGLPVLISDQIGIADYVRQTDAGVVVPLDPGIVAEKLLETLEKPMDQFARLGQNAIKAAQKYTPEKVAWTMREQFEKIVNQ